MSARVFITLFAMVALAGCQGNKQTTKKAPAEPARASKAAPKVGTKTPRVRAVPVDPCKKIVSEAKRLLAAGGKCSEDAGCACYPPLYDCGGVTDIATQRKVSTLYRDVSPATMQTSETLRPPCLSAKLRFWPLHLVRHGDAIANAILPVTHRQPPSVTKFVTRPM
jgi:hypothetical protein